MAPSIDVVIVARDRHELTESCLRHLAAQTVPHRLILVDNASAEPIAQRPDATVLRLEQGVGFGAACNLGARAGTGEVVVLLNNDVDCEREFLARLVAPLQEDPALGSVAALMLAPGAARIDSVGLVADPTLAGFPRLRGRAAGDAALPQPALTGPAGAAAAYRRSAWEQVGGMDEHISAYLEDLDVALRLRSAGWGTTAATAARGIHLGSASHGHRSASQRRHGGFARGYLLRRYGVLRGRWGPRALLTEAVVVLGDVALSRDLAALAGRVAGWRAGGGLPRLPKPPDAAIDRRIGIGRSLRMRLGIYGRGEAAPIRPPRAR
jgi:GT2 family glycosyltransferase